MSATPRPRRAFVQRCAVLVCAVLTLAFLGTAAVADDSAPAAGAIARSAPLSASAVAARGPRQPPNIVTIMTDDMRVDDLRWMPRTRALLARQGVTFRNSFSPYPLCCPARASFLTGQYAHNHEVWSQDDPYGFTSFDDSSTLPTWLRRRGYLTGFVGKYLNGYGNDRTHAGRPSLRYVPPGWTDWRGAVEGLPDGHRLSGGTYRYFDTTLNVNGVLVGNEGRYQTVLFTDHVVSMVNRFSRARRPFFIYASYVAPHHGKPHEPGDPRRTIRRADGKITEIRTPARPDRVRGRFDRVIRRPPGYLRGEDVEAKPYFIRSLPALNAEERRAVIEVTRQRAETLFLLDREVERIVDELRAARELDNTVIVFTSDNGYLLADHRVRQGKVLPYEPSLRVPLLARGPGIPRGALRFSPATTLDLAPTIADLAGATPRLTVDGRSLLDVIARDEGWRTGVVTETGKRSVLNSEENGAGLVLRGGPTRIDEGDPRFSLGLRTDRWLYVRHQSGEHELYDMAADDAQLTNLAQVPAYQKVRQTMETQLEVLRDCVGAQCREPLDPALQVPRGRIVSGRGR